MKKKLSRIIGMALISALAFTGCSGGNQVTSAETSETSQASETATDEKQSEATSAGEEKIAKLVSGGEPGSLHPALA